MSNDYEPRPIIIIPVEFLPLPPADGCLLELTLIDGRIIPCVCVDAKGMIYGVLIKESEDPKPNPINFRSEEIVSVRLLPKIVPPGHKFV